MSLQYAVSIRNAQLDAIETDVGASPILRIYAGTPPANVAAALSSNTLLAEGTLPADFLGNASNGTKGKAGTWALTGQTGAGSGTAGTFWRIYASDGATPKIQGTFGASGSGADLVADNNSIADGQTVSVSALTLTAGNA